MDEILEKEITVKELETKIIEQEDRTVVVEIKAETSQNDITAFHQRLDELEALLRKHLEEK